MEFLPFYTEQWTILPRKGIVAQFFEFIFKVKTTAKTKTTITPKSTNLWAGKNHFFCIFEIEVHIGDI